MITLTEAAYYTRRGIKYAIFAITALLIVRVIIITVTPALKDLRGKPPPPPPTVLFGKLPPIEFPKGKEPKEPINYTLDTIQGNLPEATSSAKVIFIGKDVYSFLTLDRAKQFAKLFGFKNDPEAISDTLYRWTDPEIPLRTIQRDIVSGNFTLIYDFLKDPNFFTEGKLPPYGEKANNEIKTFLNKGGLDTAGLSSGKSKVTFFKHSGNSLEVVSSVSDAEITRVDLFREPIDGLPLLTPTFTDSPIVFYLTGEDKSEKKVIYVNYIFKSIQTDIFSTYPLKIPQEAWEELKAGKGYIANPGDNPKTDINIRKIYLAYYDSDQFQNYLQPIYVFEGEGNFAAYLPAISAQWVKSATDGSEKPTQ